MNEEALVRVGLQHQKKKLCVLEPLMNDKPKHKDATPPVQLHSNASVTVNANTKLQHITTLKDSLLTINVLMIHFNIIIASSLSTKLKFLKEKKTHTAKSVHLFLDLQFQATLLPTLILSGQKTLRFLCCRVRDA